MLRPLNYPPGVPGFGSLIYKVSSGLKAAIVNISGRVFMPNLDCPFRKGQQEIERIEKETKIIVVDFHAEATSEKIAFGYFMDGKVSAVVGTHTHVQTADEKILSNGTAYITDVGMTGPCESVIGIEKDLIIQRFLTNMPARFETAKGQGCFEAVVIEVIEPAIDVAISSKTAISGALIKYEKHECDKWDCSHWNRCFPLGLNHGARYKVDKVKGSLVCPLGIQLLLVSLQTQD